MSTKKLAAVRKVLEQSLEVREWYETQHATTADSFTVQNVREYGLDGKGYVADQIIADGEDDGILAPGEVIE